MKLWRLIVQLGGDGDIYCTCFMAAENEQEAINNCQDHADDEPDCEAEEITAVTDKDGNKYRVMLVPDLSEEKEGKTNG